MLDWYERYYDAIRTSQANARFCELVYGRDLGQHGFMDEPQLQALLSVLDLKPEELVVDLGCGDGRIAELISDLTSAMLIGVDNSPKAIESALLRTCGKRDRLDFALMDVDRLALPGAACDAAIAIDSLYFAPLEDTVRGVARALRPGGRFAAYYSRSLAKDGSGRTESVQADHTPLADALRAADLVFEAWDYTREDLAHMERRKSVLVDLESDFAAEGNQFIFANRIGEAVGISQAIVDGRYSRHLYLARQRSQVG